VHVFFAASLAPHPPLYVPPQFSGAIYLGPPLPVAVSILLVAIFVIGIILRGSFFLNRRREAIRAMASRLGLRPWPGNSLPRGLSFQGTPFYRPDKVANIYEGLLNHSEVVILDFHKQESDARWARTIIAIKTVNPVAAPPDLEIRKVGSWQILSAHVGRPNTSELMEAERLEPLIKNIAR
jgi:hypothetical protein